MKYIPLLLFLFCFTVKAQVTTLPIPGAPNLFITVGVGANSAALIDLRNNAAAVNVTMGDDDNRNVPLGFSFPYFNQTFTDSWMHSNGVVSFQNPSLTGNFCCSGLNLTSTAGGGNNYAIMPLWTDLIGTGTNNHFYLRGTNEITYGWYNVNEFGTGNSNNFEVKLNSSGLVDVRLQGALISAGRPVTSGMTGNLAQGEYFQFYHGSGWSTNTPTAWSALSGTSANACLTNPLSSPTCPGYPAAYFNQQCTISALYDPACPGYAAANFTYQCSLNPLYNELCPGYAQAYFNQQCSISGLYDKKCPNYATAYATQQLLSQQKVDSGTTSSTQTLAIVTNESNSNSSSNTSTTTAGPSASPSNVTSAVPLVGAASTSSPTNPVAVVSSQSTSQSQPPTQQQQQTQPTTRAQQLQQARMQAARKEAAAKGKESMKEAAEAKTMEQQVATQGLIITAMGYNPNFDAYSALTLKDNPFYRPFEIYKNQETVDNRRAQRQLSGASDRLHNEMVQQQYK